MAMTLKDVRKYHADMAGIAAMDDKRLDTMHKHGAMVDAINAHLAQHAAMVAKLRELAADWIGQSNGVYSPRGTLLEHARQIEAVLSAEPASPAPVDIEAVWEVIAALIRSGYQRENHLAIKLSVAIGDTK